MTVTLLISLVASVIAVVSFANSIKDKSNKDIAQQQYEKGKLDTTLKNIMEKLEKIELKLESFDNEIRTICKEEIEKHILTYHK